MLYVGLYLQEPSAVVFAESVPLEKELFMYYGEAHKKSPLMLSLQVSRKTSATLYEPIIHG